MKTNPVFDNPVAYRMGKKAMQEAKAALDATPRHLLDPGNPNHPDNFDVRTPSTTDSRPPMGMV